MARYEMLIHFDNGQTFHANVSENVVEACCEDVKKGFEQWLTFSNDHSMQIINRDKIVRIEFRQLEEEQSETE